MMRIAFAVLIGLHGLIHLLGPIKAFGLGVVPQLHRAITPFFGALWLVAALLFGSAAFGFAFHASWWWWLALPGVVLSQLLIVQAWDDAKFGTIANGLIVVVLLLLSALGA